MSNHGRHRIPRAKTERRIGCEPVVRLAPVVLLALTFVGELRAEEGGSGHYLPGSMASFMDGVAPVPSIIARLNLVSYDGDVGAQREIPIGGLTVLDADVSVKALGVTMFWRPEWGSLGDNWSFGMSATVPFLDLTVGGSIDTQLPGGGTAMIRRSDSASGLGDIVLMPLMFNQLFSPSLSVNYRLAVYAPTGDYETGRLANTGKNFWTYEPIVAVVYFGQQTGFEASAFLGVSINDRNSATDYDSGNQAHLEGTVAWHRPRWGGVAGFGVTGFAYQQISDDSGSGAAFGDFRASTNGIGPVMSYIRNVGDSQLLVEGKWLHEFGVENRPEGDTLFVKVMWNF